MAHTMAGEVLAAGAAAATMGAEAEVVTPVAVEAPATAMEAEAEALIAPASSSRGKLECVLETDRSLFSGEQRAV